MKVYKRHIGSKLFALRILFLVLVILYILTLIYHLDNWRYLVTVLVLGISIIKVSGITISSDSLLSEII